MKTSMKNLMISFFLFASVAVVSSCQKDDMNT